MIRGIDVPINTPVETGDMIAVELRDGKIIYVPVVARQDDGLPVFVERTGYIE